MMQDLAFIAVAMLLGVYGSGIIAFVLSWFRNTITFVLALVFSVISIISGIAVGNALIDSNGFLIALLPVTFGVLSIVNALRRRNKAMG
jgi:hypothetical protein